MSEGTSNSIINLGDFSKPATTLIEKIAAATGWIAAPYQIKRLAKAESEADIIRAQNANKIAQIQAQGEIELTDPHRRAARRFIEEEARKQENMEQITAKALPLLEDKSKPETMEDDWITNFFDKCRIVSDQEMQTLWSKVLAGEANAPGTYSKRTVNFISNLDKNEAKYFSKLCGFGWTIDDLFVPLVYEQKDEIYKKNEIKFDTIIHLESIGLIQYQNLGNFALTNFSHNVNAKYYGETIELVRTPPPDFSIEVGKVMLTKIGKELVSICGSQPVDGFKEYILEKWQWMGYLKKEV